MVLDCPTPQRAPVVDQLDGDRTLELTVAYEHASERDGRGWGSVSSRHPHIVLRQRAYWGIPTSWRLVQRAHVVCCFGYNGVVKLSTILATRFKGRHLIMRSDSNAIQELERPWLRRKAKGLFLQRLLGPRTEVWTIGSMNEAYWRSLGFSRFIRIPYTVPAPPRPRSPSRDEARQSLGIQPNEFALLYVGRLAESKGVLDLLTAMRRLSLPNLRLLIVGGGPLASSVQAGAEDDTRLTYFGPIAHECLGDFYHAADMLVVPSHHEPWGLVVNESLLNGTPVLASDRVGSAYDLLQDKARGSVFPAGDRQSLQDAIAEAVARPPRRVSGYQEPDASSLMLKRLSEIGSL